MNLKTLLIYLIILTTWLDLNAQEKKTAKPTLMYIINGDEVTEDYVNGLDVNQIKSLNKGVSDEVKAMLVKKYGDKVNNCFIMVISLYSDEEMKKRKQPTAEEREKSEKDQLEENKNRERESTLISVGEGSVDFTVSMLDGTKIKLSDLKGKVVLLNFWATWCAPCIMEFYEIPATILNHFNNQEFVFLPVSRGESVEVVKRKMVQLKDKNIIFNVGLDPKEEIFNLYAKGPIPRNFLIDRDGNVVYTSIGFTEENLHIMASKIEELLKKN